MAETLDFSVIMPPQNRDLMMYWPEVAPEMESVPMWGIFRNEYWGCPLAGHTANTQRSTNLPTHLGISPTGSESQRVS
jgi:hypothetical protein